MTVCVCDSTMQPLEADEVYAISPTGGIPTDPSPTARGGAKVYRLLCRRKFVSLFEGHGNSATPDALAQSQRIAQEHLRLTGRL